MTMSCSLAIKVQERLTNLLVDEFYGTDVNWVQDDTLVGLPDQTYSPSAGPGFSGQRGIHWPCPPSEHYGCSPSPIK